MRQAPRPSRFIALVATALASALLAACGAAPGINAPEDVQTRVRTINPYGGDPAQEGTPKDGGNLILGLDREIVSFDPTVQNANQAAGAVYDYLLKLGPKGEIEPYLARSMDTSDGGLTWRMSLTPGVRFSDGTPFDAEAVIINTQRHIDKVSSPAHQLTERIKSMRAVDPTTVEFTLTEPTGDFASAFAQPFSSGSLAFVVSPAALAQYGDEIGEHPVGAGPFTFVDWVRDNRLVMAKNPDYWQEGLPHLDGLEFRPLPDTESRWASMANGDVDVVFGGYIVELSRAMADPNLTTYYATANGAEWVYFNFAKPPFDDHRMREAVVRAVNVDALSVSQYDNQLQPAKSVFGDDSPYHDPAASQAWPAFDPERAKQLVAEYRASGGNPDFTFKTSNAPNRVAFGEFIQAQMAAIGVNVQLQFYDLAQFSSAVVQSNDFQLTSWVGGPWESPYPAVHRLFGTDGAGNYGKYSNPRMDELLDKALDTADPAERARIYQQVDLLANQDLVVGWYSRGYLSTIAKPEVKGIVRYVSRDMFYATVWLDR
jgi:peptide/nickel transport system substrate-binding protein